MTAHGASREALAAARERLDGADGLDVRGRVEPRRRAGRRHRAAQPREARPRRVLTDPAQPGEAKAELAQRLLGAQVGGPTADPWPAWCARAGPQSRDLVDALEELASIADLTAAAAAERALDDVEDELFRFGRIVSSNTELRAALTDRTASKAAKSELLHRPPAAGAADHPNATPGDAPAGPRPGRSLQAGLESLSKLAADRRNRMVAVVTSAVPLSDGSRSSASAPLGGSTAA